MSDRARKHRIGLSLAVASATLVLGPAAANAAVSQVGDCAIGPSTACPGANLAGADLNGANLQGADLSGANLHGAQLNDANLRGTNLTGANLTGVSAQRAHLNEGGFLQPGARIDGANFHGANLKEANLSYAIGRRANLNSVVLTGARMHFAHLHNASFNGSQLDLAHLGYLDAQHASMRHTNFAGSALHLAHLNHADLHGANFHGATLHLTQLTAADLSNANFAHAAFGHTQTHAAKTHDTNLWPSNFDSDHLAVIGLFEPVRAHLDAYGGYDGWGLCAGVHYIKWLIDAPEGYCHGTPQPGGTHGFDGGGRINFLWDWERHHDVKIKGHHGVKLEGRTSSNWGAFYVHKVHGLSAHGTGDRAVGHPGGPIGLDLRKQTYWDPTLGYGYTMFVGGWLRRTSDPSRTYGPIPERAR